MSDIERIIKDRIFALPNPTTSNLEWFCMARERILGPYPSRDLATLALSDFIKSCEQRGDTGGRSEEDEVEFHKWLEAEAKRIQDQASKGPKA
jgi:hypothetical protein